MEVSISCRNRTTSTWKLKVRWTMSIRRGSSELIVRQHNDDVVIIIITLTKWLELGSYEQDKHKLEHKKICPLRYANTRWTEVCFEIYFIIPLAYAYRGLCFKLALMSNCISLSRLLSFFRVNQAIYIYQACYRCMVDFHYPKFETVGSQCRQWSWNTRPLCRRFSISQISNCCSGVLAGRTGILGWRKCNLTIKWNKKH
jgi:hypothetical protein